MNNYTIISELDSGCFGTVYLVKHNETNQQYAIKEIEACFVGLNNAFKKIQFEKLFLKEIEGLKLFSSFNIGPKVYDYWISFPKGYIVMEKCDMNLESYLASVESCDKLRKNEWVLRLKTLFNEIIDVKEKHKLLHSDAQIHNIMVNICPDKGLKEIKFIDCAYSRIVEENDEYFLREQSSLKRLLDEL